MGGTRFSPKLQAAQEDPARQRGRGEPGAADGPHGTAHQKDSHRPRHSGQALGQAQVAAENQAQKYVGQPISTVEASGAHAHTDGITLAARVLCKGLHLRVQTRIPVLCRHCHAQEKGQGTEKLSFPSPPVPEAGRAPLCLDSPRTAWPLKGG